MTSYRKRDNTNGSGSGLGRRGLGVLACVLLAALLYWAFRAPDTPPPVSTDDDVAVIVVPTPTPAAPPIEDSAEIAPVTPAPPPAPPRGAAAIHAVVTDRIGDPVAGAKVTLERRGVDEAAPDPFSMENISDAGGEALFTGLPEGYYIARAESNGRNGWAGAALGGRWPGAASVNIVLKPSGAITGRVVNHQRQPVSEAAVDVLDLMTGGPPLQRAYSDSDGSFLFEDLPVGQYQLQADAAGYAASLSDTLAIDGPPVTLVMARGTRLSGLVLRASDRSPVSGVRVGLTADDYRDLKFAAASDVQGKFFLDDVPEGVAFVTSDDPRYTFVPPQSRIDVRTGVNARVELLLEDAARVSGRVSDPTTGKAIAGVVIEARTPDGRRNWLSPPTDGEGNYELAGIPPGPVRVFLGRVPVPYGRGVNESEQNITLQPGEVLEGLDFEAPSGVMVCGTVVDGQGRPVPGATVSLSAPHPKNGEILGFRHTDTDASGVFCFANADVAVIPVGRSDYRRGIIQLEANHRGARSEIVSLPDVSESVSDVVLELLPRAAGVIAGRVVDERGNPAVASLRLSQPELTNQFDRRLSRTDADGHFLFQDLAAGEYEIWMAPDNGTGYNAGKKLALALTLSEGQRVTDLRLVVSEGGVITGTVVDSSGTPLQGAKIEAWDEYDDEVGGAFTDREGHFRITNLDGDQFELRPRDDVPGGPWSLPARPGDHVLIEVPAAQAGAPDL